VYLVTAVRVGDVLCVRNEMGELLLRIFLRGIGDVAEVRGPKLAARSSAVHLLELAGTVMPLLRDVIATVRKLLRRVTLPGGSIGC
jgi:hypothetical protein